MTSFISSDDITEKSKIDDPTVPLFDGEDYISQYIRVFLTPCFYKKAADEKYYFVEDLEKLNDLSGVPKIYLLKKTLYTCDYKNYKGAKIKREKEEKDRKYVVRVLKIYSQKVEEAEAEEAEKAAKAEEKISELETYIKEKLVEIKNIIEEKVKKTLEKPLDDIDIEKVIESYTDDVGKIEVLADKELDTLNEYFESRKNEILNLDQSQKNNLKNIKKSYYNKYSDIKNNIFDKIIDPENCDSKSIDKETLDKKCSDLKEENIFDKLDQDKNQGCKKLASKKHDYCSKKRSKAEEKAKIEAEEVKNKLEVDEKISNLETYTDKQLVEIKNKLEEKVKEILEQPLDDIEIDDLQGVIEVLAEKELDTLNKYFESRKNEILDLDQSQNKYLEPTKKFYIKEYNDIRDTILDKIINPKNCESKSITKEILDKKCSDLKEENIFDKLGQDKNQGCKNLASKKHDYCSKKRSKAKMESEVKAKIEVLNKLEAQEKISNLKTYIDEELDKIKNKLEEEVKEILEKPLSDKDIDDLERVIENYKVNLENSAKKELDIFDAKFENKRNEILSLNQSLNKYLESTKESYYDKYINIRDTILDKIIDPENCVSKDITKEILDGNCRSYNIKEYLNNFVDITNKDCKWLARIKRNYCQNLNKKYRTEKNNIIEELNKKLENLINDYNIELENLKETKQKWQINEEQEKEIIDKYNTKTQEIIDKYDTKTQEINDEKLEKIINENIAILETTIKDLKELDEKLYEKGIAKLVEMEEKKKEDYKNKFLEYKEEIDKIGIEEIDKIGIEEIDKIGIEEIDKIGIEEIETKINKLETEIEKIKEKIKEKIEIDKIFDKFYQKYLNILRNNHLIILKCIDLDLIIKDFKSEITNDNLSETIYFKNKIDIFKKCQDTLVRYNKHLEEYKNDLEKKLKDKLEDLKDLENVEDLEDLEDFIEINVEYFKNLKADLEFELNNKYGIDSSKINLEANIDLIGEIIDNSINPEYCQSRKFTKEDLDTECRGNTYESFMINNLDESKNLNCIKESKIKYNYCLEKNEEFKRLENVKTESKNRNNQQREIVKKYIEKSSDIAERRSKRLREIRENR